MHDCVDVVAVSRRWYSIGFSLCLLHNLSRPWKAREKTLRSEIHFTLVVLSVLHELLLALFLWLFVASVNRKIIAHRHVIKRRNITWANTKTYARGNLDLRNVSQHDYQFTQAFLRYRSLNFLVFFVTHLARKPFFANLTIHDLDCETRVSPPDNRLETEVVSFKRCCVFFCSLSGEVRERNFHCPTWMLSGSAWMKMEISLTFCFSYAIFRFFASLNDWCLN